MSHQPPDRLVPDLTARASQEAPLPDDVRRFILTSVSSIPYLEALLLLQSNPEQAWTATELARRLYVETPIAQDLLALLVADKLILAIDASERSFKYQPASEHLRETVTQLSVSYSKSLLAVTLLVHAKSEARNKRAEQFAEAFRWKKES